MTSKARKPRLLLALSLALLIISLLVPVGTRAAGDAVAAQDARQAALAWIGSCPTFADAKYVPDSGLSEIRSADGRQLLAYVLELEPPGYVIVTPSYDLEPIIAYSNASTFAATEAPENVLLDLLRADLPKRLEALQEGRLSDYSRDMARAAWASYLSGDLAQDATGLNRPQADLAWDVDHGPFLSTVWGQGDNGAGAATFNYCTPPGPDGDADNYVAGCVATAMGQILNHYQWPITGTGSHSYLWSNGEDPDRVLAADFGSTSYDWANMLNNYVGTGSETERQAVGELLYHAGVAVDMNYSAGGSGAFTDDVADALGEHFGTQGAWAENTGAGFYDQLYTNMTNHRPAELSIRDTVGPISGGHAVVVDGVQHMAGETKYYHLNMGWYGSYDTWYDIASPFTTGNYTWDTVNGAVLNIVPIPDLLDPGDSTNEPTFDVAWETSLNQGEDCFELQQLVFPFATSSLTDGAEIGTTNWTISNDWETTALSKHGGANSFRGYFTAGSWLNTMELAESLLIEAETSISYWWRTNTFFPVGQGTAEARLEISTDRTNWSTLASHTDASQTTWTQQTIPASSLTSYEDQLVTLRLTVQAWGSYYLGDYSPSIGFFMDDLSIDEVRRGSGWVVVDADILAESKSVTVTEYGDFFFRTRAYCDGTWGDWSGTEDLTVYKPDSVDLASLSAEPAPGGIRVGWETGSEESILGFDLFRAESAAGLATQVNTDLIPAKRLGSIDSASYSFLDTDVTPAQTYWYWLHEVNTSGSAVRHGPVRATAIANQPPANVAVSPDDVLSKPWQPIEFTCTYVDPDGWQDIRFAELLVNDRRSVASGVWIRYYPASGRTLLRIPDKRRWQRLRGDPATRMNPSAIVELGDVVKDGQTLQVTYRIKPKGAFLGAWDLYLRVRDLAGLTDGFDDMGDWVVAR